MQPRFAICLVIAGVVSTLLFPSASRADKTIFRFTDFDLRDPHMFVTIPILGCADITNYDQFGIKGLNPAMQEQMQGDSDEDGNLDLNYVIVFDPLAQGGSGGTLAFGGVSCTAPLAGTTCAVSLLPNYPYSNSGASSCLAAIPGTTNAAYSPALITPGPPCFVATVGSVTLDVMFTLTLTDVYVAATYAGDPATGLVNGMLRGFISQASANATILPPDFPGAAGQPLSSVLRGGVGCCSQPSPATGDRDIGPGGVSGWYFYFNFAASIVSETPTGVGDGPTMSLDLEAPHPNPFNPTTTIRYTLPETAPVTVAIYDAAGRVVSRLESGVRDAGVHVATWNGLDARGNGASSGVYFVRLESRGETRVRKIVLLK